MRGLKILGFVLAIIAFLGAALNVASFVILHAVLADFGQELMASFGWFGADLLAAVEIDARLIFFALLGTLVAAGFELVIGTLIVMRGSRRWR